MEYKAGEFSGPLDLLLHLIAESEVNIYDIPISEITDQFLGYLSKAKENVPLADLTDFYRMAATLLYIKSRMLLPVDVEYDDEWEDPRAGLVEQLLEYQKFRRYSELLAPELMKEGDELLLERAPSSFLIPFSDEEIFQGCGPEDLLSAFTELVSKMVSSAAFNVYEEVSINEKLALMTEIFEKKESFDFEELVVDAKSVNHIIAAFLAVLSAVKDKIALISQSDGLYSKITISKRPLDFDPDDADEIDREFEEREEKGLTEEDDFSIINVDSDDKDGE